MIDLCRIGLNETPGFYFPFWPFSAKCRPMIAKILQLNSNNSETNKDISLKFSAFVYHMSGLNWQKNFDHYLICVSVAPSSRQKLWAPLATIFVEKKFWKKFWWCFRHIWVTPWKEFLISWKKWCFEIFRTALPSRTSVVHALSHHLAKINCKIKRKLSPMWQKMLS